MLNGQYTGFEQQQQQQFQQFQQPYQTYITPEGPYAQQYLFGGGLEQQQQYEFSAPQQFHYQNGAIPTPQVQLPVPDQFQQYITNDLQHPRQQFIPPPQLQHPPPIVQPHPAFAFLQQQPQLRPQHQPPPQPQLLYHQQPPPQFRPLQSVAPIRPMLPTLDDRLPDIPVLTQELSKNLDPGYAKELDILYILLYGATTKDEAETIISGFAKKFLLLPFLWKYRLQLNQKLFMTQIQNENQAQITRRGLYDFYSIDTFQRYQTSFKCFDRIFLSDWRRQDWDNDKFGQLEVQLKKARENLFFPHEHLVEVYKLYEAHSDQILLQKDYLKYKKALQLCRRIIAAESLRELFCCFIEIEDPKTVIQNVELLIAQNPTCQWLWKSYLQYLRDRQPKVYLDVFQKYLRFFITDKPMFEHFQNERDRIYSTTNNLNSYQSLEDFLMEKKKPEKYSTPQEHSYRVHFSSTFSNAFEQKFSIPPTLIQYLLQKASPQQLNALFETCKQLFLLSSTPICCNLTVTNYSHHDQNNFRSPCFKQSFKFSRFLPLEVKNIFLAKSLTIEAPKPSTMLSSIVGKLSKCEIWSLNVKGQTIFWNELKFLMESGNIEKFIFMEGYIAEGYGKMAAIEDVVAMLPKAHTVIMDSAAFTPQTFTSLSSLDRLTKFKEFSIEKLSPCFKIFDLECFIMKHAAPDSIFNFGFDSSTPNDFIKKFNNFVKTLFKDWPVTEIKPRVYIQKRKK